MMKRILITIIMTLSFMTGASAQIDVHSHFIPESYMDFIKAHGAEMDEGFPIPSYDTEKHLAFMDAAGIEMSVLTMPAPQPWFGDAEESAEFCRKYNEACAKLKARYPDRFLFCAALPLPSVDKAVEEAVYALDHLGADGVKLASNSYGQYLGDEELEPLMQVLNERKAVIITHPHKPSAVNSKLTADVPMASYEYLAETTRALLNMVAHNVPVRYPDLKIVVPHCGSFLPNALPRFKGLLPVMVNQGYMQPVDADANLANLYYDLAGAATDDVIRTLLTITSPDHILYGTDYPYVAEPVLLSAKKSLEERLPGLGLDPQAIFSGNARRLFGMTEDKTDKITPDAGKALYRLAEIEVHPEYLTEYLAAAAEIQKASLAEEPGVICLFPTQLREDSCQIRILEIYASQEAYEHHIKTDHFLKYKQGTLHMVKFLKLHDLQPLTPETVSTVFKRQD